MLEIYKYNLEELSPDDLNLINSLSRPFHFHKGYNITTEGQIEKYLYFVEAGVVRFWKMKFNGEITFDFISSGGLATCYESFTTGQPSKINMQAISELKGLRLSKENAEKIFTLNEKTRDLKIRIMDRLIILKFNREIELTCDSPEERYRNL